MNPLSWIKTFSFVAPPPTEEADSSKKPLEPPLPAQPEAATQLAGEAQPASVPQPEQTSQPKEQQNQPAPSLLLIVTEDNQTNSEGKASS